MAYLHFSIGPVQEFVSQARRTSDFWSGSFLLSWLSGVAMCAVRLQKGEIIFPIPPENYLDWIQGNKSPKSDDPMSRIGAIPNRFKAKVDNDFDGRLVVEAVRQAWIALSKHTLENDEIELDELSKIVWARQIAHNSGGLWDMQWVIVDDEADSSALDRRKNWRVHYPPEEPGTKCTLMGSWQELSGRSGEGAAEFWKMFTKFDIGDSERLCAHAYVKRRFVRHFASFQQETHHNNTIFKVVGWQLSLAGVPSTHYLAAVPWLTRVLKSKSNTQLLTNFEKAAKESQVSKGEANTHLTCIEEASEAYTKTTGLVPDLQKFDGVAFYEDEIRNSKELISKEQLITSLKSIQSGESGKASKYYAMLLMDGDSLGKQIAHAGQNIAQALKQFTDGVDAIVRQHSGFLVYAGGDDVFALLPMTDVLLCSVALRTLYMQCFEPYKDIKTPSISAAIEFVQYKTPLTQVINDAHRLLDDVAKDMYGRDSLAIRVLKGAGLHLTWGRPWNGAINEIGDNLKIMQIAKDLEDNPDLFSTGFFYRSREIYRSMEGIDDPNAVKELILYEYGHSLSASGKALEKSRIESLLEPLFEQSLPMRRTISATGDIAYEKFKSAEADAALLVRFFVQKGAIDGLT